MMLAQPTVTMRVETLVDLYAGSVFVTVGAATSAIAVLRHRRGTPASRGERIFFWLGLWSAIYGINDSWPLIDAFAPHWLMVAKPYIRTLMTYLVLPFAALAWMEATKGWMRRLTAWMIGAEFLIAAAGLLGFVTTGDPDRLIPLNNSFAAVGSLILLVVVTNRRLFEKFSMMPSRGFFAVAAFLFTLESSAINIANPLGFHPPYMHVLDHLGFALLISAFGHSALQMVRNNETQLLAIQNELELARQIQASILPTAVPKIAGLHISATYQPAASVAGDFYEFVADGGALGILVADVCGHGVPAALIASMLKVAVPTAASRASDPGEFLAALNRTLAEPLRGRLVSAAYLWVNPEQGRARYSGAGHPPLLVWRDGTMKAIESNGLLFGVLPECVYPTTEIAIAKGDRFLLYTDGVSEPENSRGESFGEARLAEVLAASVRADTVETIVAELRGWQNGGAQQDDITLIVVDVGTAARDDASGVSLGSIESYSPVTGF